MKTSCVSKFKGICLNHFLAFEEPLFYGIEDTSNRSFERKQKLQHHIEFLNTEVYKSMDESQKLKQQDLILSKQLSLAFDALTNTFQKFKVDSESWKTDKDSIPKKKNRRKKNRKKAKLDGDGQEISGIDCNGISDCAQDVCNLNDVDEESDNNFE